MAENDVYVVNQGQNSLAPVRTIQVVTNINGTPTTVQMQVVSIADESGNVIRDFASYNLQTAMLVELRAIRTALAQGNGTLDLTAETLPVVGL